MVPSAGQQESYADEDGRIACWNHTRCAALFWPFLPLPLAEAADDDEEEEEAAWTGLGGGCCACILLLFTVMPWLRTALRPFAHHISPLSPSPLPFARPLACWSEGRARCGGGQNITRQRR